MLCQALVARFAMTGGALLPPWIAAMMNTDYKPIQTPIQTELPLTWSTPGAWVDAHFVALLPGSKKPSGPWRNHYPDYQSIQQHVADGGNAGLVPASVRLDREPLAVLDQDAGRAAVMVATYPPIACAPTRGDRHHLYYRDRFRRGNGQWSGPGGCAGEVRSANGYAALHGDELRIVDQCLAGGLRADVGWLPAHLIIDGGRGAGTDTDADTTAALALAWSLWLSVVRTVRPVDIGAAPGQRHVALVRRVTSWAGRRTWNTAEVNDSYIAARCAAYWMGLRDRQTFPEDEAVGVLSWALATRERMQAQPHTPEFLVKQAVVGRMGKGVPRSASLFDDMTTEQARPWEAEGVSRRTWYRHQSGQHTGPRGRPKLK